MTFLKVRLGLFTRNDFPRIRSHWREKYLMNPEPESQAQMVFMRAQQALRGNLDRVLSVSGDDRGAPRSLSRSHLSRVTGIARSTVTKLLCGPKSKPTESAESATAMGVSQANPDLDTLCRLASALAVPPAFLLMSSTDWKRLIQAVANMHELASLTGNAKLRHRSTTDVAQAALDVHASWERRRAVLPGAAELAKSEAFAGEQERMRQATSRHTKSTAALVNWDRIPEGGETALLLAVCVHMAASLAAETLEEAPNGN